MTKYLTFIIAATAIIGLSFFSIQQISTISKKNQLLVKQDQYITELKTTGSEDNTIIVDLRSENEILRQQINMLKDSIDFLNNRITILKKSAYRKNRVLQDVKAQLDLYQARHDQLELEIKDQILASNEKKNEPAQMEKLEKLEAQKTKLLSQVAELKLQQINYEKEKIETDNQLQSQQSEEARYQRTANLINNTQVKFITLSPRSKRFSKTLRKIKNKWNYTAVEFQLINEDLRLLLQSNFIVRIVNADTQEVITSHEADSKIESEDIPETNATTFKYSGDMVKMFLYNHQPKAAENYEIQLFYLDELGKEYLLRHGIKKFVKEGKVVKQPA